MSHGVAGLRIFETPEDYLDFLVILAELAWELGFKVLAYSLMVTHFHLLVESGLVHQSQVMQRLLLRYSQRFNWKRSRMGHVFQGRYKAKLVHDDTYYATVLPYIHNNPVKDGFVADPLDWIWSSHRQFIHPPRSVLVDVDRALSRLGTTREEALERYTRIMASPGLTEPEFDEYSIDVESRFVPPPAAPLEELASAFTELRHPNPGVRGGHQLALARARFSRLARAQGHRQRQIAAFLGVCPSAISRLLRLE